MHALSVLLIQVLRSSHVNTLDQKDEDWSHDMKNSILILFVFQDYS